MYLLPSEGGTDSNYNEYFLVDGVPEVIGTAPNVDLSNYVTTSSLDHPYSKLPHQNRIKYHHQQSIQCLCTEGIRLSPYY